MNNTRVSAARKLRLREADKALLLMDAPATVPPTGVQMTFDADIRRQTSSVRQSRLSRARAGA
jgi:hypothetical protein